MSTEKHDREAAAARVALAEMDMFRRSETILGNIGLPTWGDNACILLRPSSAVKEPTETDYPSLGFYVLGQEYFVATVTGGPMDGAYFVVDLANETDQAPACFVSLDEAIIHVIELAHQAKTVAELESNLNALATELETAADLLDTAIGAELQAGPVKKKKRARKSS